MNTNIGIYISNAAYTLKFKRSALYESTIKELILSKMYEKIALTEDAIITMIKDTYKHYQILNSTQIHYPPKSTGWYKLLNPICIERPVSTIAEKAYELFELQALTNCYAYKRGASINDIMAISYNNPLRNQDTIDKLSKALEQSNNTKAYLRDAANYLLSSAFADTLYSRETWDRLTQKGMIPPYGYCNALNEFYLTDISIIIRRRYDDKTILRIANCLNEMINDVLVRKNKKKGQTKICHIVMALFFCGYIDDIYNTIDMIGQVYNLKIDKGLACRIMRKYWDIICDKTGIRILSKGTKSQRVYATDQMKNCLSMYIDNDEDSWVEKAIKDTPCHNYYAILIQIKDTARKRR